MLRFAVPTSRITSQPLSALPITHLPSDRLFLGVYDSETRAFEDALLDVEQEFISWEVAGDMSAFLAATRTKHRVPLITIEPWVTASGVTARVLTETVAGRNDDLILANAHAIREHVPQQVMISFAHEMDLVGKYPWALANPQMYVRAYRHYVDLIRAEGVANVTWLWSPTGTENAAAYYPGDDYVDMIGVTALVYQGNNIRTGARGAASFDSCFSPIYSRTEGFSKPIIIAELGIAADGGDQAQWLSEAFVSFDRYPLLHGVVYFHSQYAPNTRCEDEPDFRLRDAATQHVPSALPFSMQWRPDRVALEAVSERATERPIPRHRAGRPRGRLLKST